MGTVNYMSPEAIQRMNNQTVLKVSLCRTYRLAAGWLNDSFHIRAMSGHWAVSFIR